MGGWVGGWVSDPPPRRGGVGHLSVCGHAKILGGWVPELTPPPPRVAKQKPVPWFKGREGAIPTTTWLLWPLLRLG